MFSISDGSVYGPQIRQFFQTQFPTNTAKTDGDVLELLTAAIVATGKVRLGAKPSIETLYLIRKYVTGQIFLQKPINFLMPWGSEKPGHLQTVDIAEVAAMKTLSCLQQRVQHVYAPGIHIRVRVEDATAPNLFPDNREQARMDAKVYTTSLERLVWVLGVRDYVELVPESHMITEEKFERAFAPNYDAMLAFLSDTEGMPEELYAATTAHWHLRDLGWMGIVPLAQREHYRATYRRLYGLSDQAATAMLARYLAQSLTRKHLRMLGNLDWADYLGLSFVGPIPGDPTGIASKRLYYRTLPENVSSMHLAPWRAKGYLAVGEDGLRPRLASWQEHRQYTRNTVTLTAGDVSVDVQSDYEVM